jgi:hypothetical protein
MDPLPDAFAGQHSAIALDLSGVPVISGYFAQPYGDLLYGVASAASSGAEIVWEFVDGVPSDAVCEGDTDGPRAGIAEPGDDVGWDTDIVTDSNGYARISYFDRTNGDLKYAAFDGSQFNIHTVDDVGFTGQYTSMVLDGEGKPIIAYMTAWDEGNSYLKIVWATTTNPTVATDWKAAYIVDQVVVPCEGDNCDSGVSNFNGVPVGVGLYSSLGLYSDNTPAVAYYDSLNGNLKFTYYNSGTDSFNAPQILAGEDDQGQDTGDLGTDLSMFITDSDDVHLVYIDADLGDLYHLEFAGRSTSGAAVALIDAGSRDANGDPVDLGSEIGELHWVGNFAKIVVDDMSTPRVAYQDGTNLDMVYAEQNQGGVWEKEIIARRQYEDQFDGAFGFFIDIAVNSAGDQVFISHFKHNLRTDPWSSELILILK